MHACSRTNTKLWTNIRVSSIQCSKELLKPTRQEAVICGLYHSKLGTFLEKSPLTAVLYSLPTRLPLLWRRSTCTCLFLSVICSCSILSFAGGIYAPPVRVSSGSCSSFFFFMAGSSWVELWVTVRSGLLLPGDGDFRDLFRSTSLSLSFSLSLRFSRSLL